MSASSKCYEEDGVMCFGLVGSNADEGLKEDHSEEAALKPKSQLCLDQEGLIQTLASNLASCDHH